MDPERGDRQLHDVVRTRLQQAAWIGFGFVLVHRPCKRPVLDLSAGIPGGSYDWGYSAFFPDPARVIGLNELVEPYAGPGCSGAPIGGYFLPIFPGMLNTWVGPTSTLVMPPGATSIRLGFGALGVGGAQPFAYFDDVFFGVTGTVPPIDPPPPPPSVPSLSRAGAAALGFLLAAAALRSLRG